MTKERLDVHLGPLRELLEADAQALGTSPGALLRDCYRDWRLGQSEIADRVRIQVLLLAEASQPDERFDPEDDPRGGLAIENLAALLGSAYAAQGIADAMSDLWTAWRLEQRDLLIGAKDK
jgi:hypothetical protein